MSEHEVTQAVGQVHPAQGWAPPRRARPRRGLAAGVSTVAAAGVAAVLVSGVLAAGPGPVPPATGRTVAVEDSYVIDVGDLGAVLAYTDTVVLGRVQAITGQDADEGWTYARVRVLDTVSGSPPATLTVRQRGYVDDAGTAHVTEGQPMLRAGRLYLLATSDEPDTDTYTVVAGPHGAVDPGPDPGALVAAYRADLP